MYYENFDKLCKDRNIRPNHVSKGTGIPTSTLTNWKKGLFTPKTDKLQKIADYFDVPLSVIVGEQDLTDVANYVSGKFEQFNDGMEINKEVRLENGFVLDQQTLDLMEFLAVHKEYREIVEAAISIAPEDIDRVSAILKAFKRKESE